MIIRHNKPGRMSAKNRKVENKTGEKTVYLYGDIGGFWGIDSQEWVKEFDEITADIIHLRIDSDGGDVFAARAMQTVIKQHKATVIAHIDGLAASAASFLAMGADEIEIVEGGFLMIHNAISFFDIFGFFNSADLDVLTEDIARAIGLLNKIDDSIVADYAKKTGKETAEIKDWMAEETWFTAEEALENGFVDRIYDGEPVDNKYDLSLFANAPECLKKRCQGMSKREIEKALRDVGLSNKAAKEILAGKYKDQVRDEVDLDIDLENGVQRDVEPVIEPKEPEPKKDRTSALLTKAEIIAPSKSE